MQEDLNTKFSHFQEQLDTLKGKILSLENSRKDQRSIGAGDLDKNTGCSFPVIRK